MAEFEQDKVSEYVDRPGMQGDTSFLIAQFKEASEAYDQLYNKLNTKRLSINSSVSTKDTVSAVKQASGANLEFQRILDKSASVIAKYNGQSAELLKNAKAIAQAELSNAKATKEAAAARAQNAKAIESEAKAASISAKERERSAKAAMDEEKIADQLANDYLQLSKAYNEAALRAKNLALRLGENHPVTQQAIKDAKGMYDVLLRVDQAVGQSQRNVGNYKSAFDGMRISFAQVARELPSLTISVQQFALAISNNLPMVADEIAKAKVEIAELRKQGQQVPGVFSRVISSLVGWQVLLSVGIALITAYAGKLVTFVQGLFDSSVAAAAARKAVFELVEQQLKLNQLLEDYYNLTSRRTGTELRDAEIRVAQARALGKSEEEILKLEREMLRLRQEMATYQFFSTDGENKLKALETALQDATFELAKFIETPIIDGEAVKRDGDAFKEREKQLEKSVEKAKYEYSRQRAIVEEYYDSNRDAQVKDLELQEALQKKRDKIASDEAKALLEIFKIRTQAQADTSGETADAFLIGTNARLDARQKQFEAEKAIISAESVFALKELKRQAKEEELTEADIKERVRLINVKYADDVRRIREKLSSDLFTIRQEEIAREQELLEQDLNLFQPEDKLEQESQLNEKRFAARKASVEEARDLRLTELENEENIQLRRAKSQAERDKIEKEFQVKRVKRELEANRDILTAALEFAQAELAIVQKRVLFKDQVERRANETQQRELEAQIAELKKQLAALGGIEVEIKTDKSVEELNKLKNKIQEIGGIAISIFSTIGDAVGNSIDRQKNAIQDLIDQIDKAARSFKALSASGKMTSRLPI